MLPCPHGARPGPIDTTIDTTYAVLASLVWSRDAGQNPLTRLAPAAISCAKPCNPPAHGDYAWLVPAPTDAPPSLQSPSIPTAHVPPPPPRRPPLPPRLH